MTINMCTYSQHTEVNEFAARFLIVDMKHSIWPPWFAMGQRFGDGNRTWCGTFQIDTGTNQFPYISYNIYKTLYHIMLIHFGT